jgi:DNA-binding MarR family transcriptional regulator
MPTDDLKHSDYAALADFRYQIRRFLHFSEQAARGAGVEPQQHQLMLAVKAVPMGEAHGARIADLAERLQIQHHSAVELIDRLEERELVRRSRGIEDRREVHVKLTSQGERVLQELTLHHRKEVRSAAPALLAALRHVVGREQKTSPRRPQGRPRASAKSAKRERP